MSQNQAPDEVLGIVHPSGCGGGRIGKEEFWTLRFTLQPWRTNSGQLEESSLKISKTNLTKEQLKELSKKIKPYDVLKVKIQKFERKESEDSIRAELLQEPEQVQSDQLLNARAKELQKPITVQHAYFGTLTLSRALNWYETKFGWNAHSIELYVSRDEGEADQDLFLTAETICKKQEEWDKRAREFAATKLLELKNDTWVDEDEIEVTEEQFKQRMNLESIVVFAKGNFEFTFNDGDLFWGHVIQVRGSLSEGLQGAGIAG